MEAEFTRLEIKHEGKYLRSGLVGSVGFEPTTSRAPGQRGTSLAASSIYPQIRRLAQDSRVQHQLSNWWSFPWALFLGPDDCNQCEEYYACEE
jgi:hypothetical protein